MTKSEWRKNDEDTRSRSPECSRLADSSFALIIHDSIVIWSRNVFVAQDVHRTASCRQRSDVTGARLQVKQLPIGRAARVFVAGQKLCGLVGPEGHHDAIERQCQAAPDRFEDRLLSGPAAEERLETNFLGDRPERGDFLRSYGKIVLGSPGRFTVKTRNRRGISVSGLRAIRCGMSTGWDQ